MKFCSNCGAAVELAIPEGDNRLRHVCTRCSAVHYQNPRLVLGCIAEWQGKVLLCRRAIEPAYGFWTLPAGFMENGETTAEAAARETLEEACASVGEQSLFALVNIPHISQVHIYYRAPLLDGAYGVGSESLAAELFAEEEIPWDGIAFRSVRFALDAWFADRRNGSFGVHSTDLPAPSGPPPWKS